jgi:hypothetical protein
MSRTKKDADGKGAPPVDPEVAAAADLEVPPAAVDPEVAAAADLEVPPAAADPEVAAAADLEVPPAAADPEVAAAADLEVPPAAAQPEEVVHVRLSCTYSGDDDSWNAGALVPVSTTELARLRGLGVVIAEEGML